MSLRVWGAGTQLSGKLYTGAGGISGDIKCVVYASVPFRITAKGTYDTAYIVFWFVLDAQRCYSWLSRKPMPVLRTLPTKTSYHFAIRAMGTTLSGVMGPPPMKPEM